MRQGKTRNNDEGRVTMCSATDCAYNESLRCVAPHVDVGRHGEGNEEHADCETYTRNQHLPTPRRL
ncbi:MAG: DUF1540 domain-containing protein [Chloroflexi bacterium]|nr:DUF1540 domain-containing protein [Chloroflexota bacterium]